MTGPSQGFVIDRANAFLRPCMRLRVTHCCWAGRGCSHLTAVEALVVFGRALDLNAMALAALEAAYALFLYLLPLQ